MKMPRPARRVYRTLRPGWGSRGGSCWRAIRQGIANWKLIEADERWEQVTVAAPRLVNSNIGSKDFPCLRKLIAKAPAQRPPGCGLPVGRRTRQGKVTEHRVQTFVVLDLFLVG